MNTKINELIAAAGLEWCAQQEQDKQNLETFAKLIIAECNTAIRIDYSTHYATHYSNYKHRPDDCEDAINKHFNFEDWS
jgi:hypothetical protein